jgi:hypothetical protein
MSIWKVNRASLAGTLVVAGACAFSMSLSPARADFTGCSVVEVAVWTRTGSRIHVLCDQAVLGNVRFFAISAGDPDAGRIQSLATAALVAKKQLNITFDSNPANNPPSCLPTDCRLLQAAGISR